MLDHERLKSLTIAAIWQAYRRGRITAGQAAAASRVVWPATPRILGESVKVRKGEKLGVLTAVLYLAPATASVVYGGANLCPFASRGCAAACLGEHSGRMRFSQSGNARAWKTLAFRYARSAFLEQLDTEIRSHARTAARKGLIPAVRLNGSSDIDWSARAELHPTVRFYEYTKSRARALATETLPPNLHYTFSADERTSEAEIRYTVRRGVNVAIVFESRPEEYLGIPVIDGDESDVRFGDPVGCIVGLSSKGGPAKADASGFVVRAE